MPFLEDEHYTGYDFWDAHWTQTMKDAALRLIASQFEARIASFKKAPSSPLYLKLVNESPDLKTTLLQVTRTSIFTPDPSSKCTISYGTAAEIFNVSSQTDDLVRLLDAMPSFSSDPTITQAKLKIVKHISKQAESAHRQAALDIIKHQLHHAKDNALENVYEAFPGFDDAADWLEEMIDKNNLTAKTPEGPRDYFAMTPDQRKLIDLRDRYLDEFVERAAYGGDKYMYNDRGDHPMEGVDSDDSDYALWKNVWVPDMTSWVVVLQEWPDKEEAKKVWDSVKESDSENILFSVDGAAECLASRCVLLHLSIPFITDVLIQV
jgi:hypothetical protein